MNAKTVVSTYFNECEDLSKPKNDDAFLFIPLKIFLRYLGTQKMRK